MSRYIMFNCPACGAPLEVLADYTVIKSAERYGGCGYEKHELMRHCNSCHRDWANEVDIKFGDVTESQLRRKFGG